MSRGHNHSFSPNLFMGGHNAKHPACLISLHSSHPAFETHLSSAGNDAFAHGSNDRWEFVCANVGMGIDQNVLFGAMLYKPA